MEEGLATVLWCIPSGKSCLAKIQGCHAIENGSYAVVDVDCIVTFRRASISEIYFDTSEMHIIHHVEVRTNIGLE